MNLDEYAETFELLGDWEQRYQYFVELGEALPELPEKFKTDNNRVKGCMSKVWLIAIEDNRHIKFQGDCDTSVIKGVLALLFGLCENMTMDEISKINMDEIFERLSLDEHLSPNRHVGVYAIFDLMKQKARKPEKSIRAA